LAPGPPEAPVQFIDVRDLAVWIIKLIEQRQTGIFNATGPAQPLSMGQFLAACTSLFDRKADLTWVDETFLLAQEVGPFVELPLWLPESLHNLMRADCSKAIQAGLTFQSISQTAQETLAWSKTRPDDHPWRAGLSREREQALLKLWKQGA
jgi:2'-hydroxyisoflavone reductase